MTPAWWKPSKPEEIRPEPWLGTDAKRYFGSLLKPDMTVLEFGAGGSTLWMADKVKEIMSVENNAAWLDTIKDKSLKNVTLYYWNEPEPPEFEQLFDLVFIDGEPVERRANWIMAVPHLVKMGGNIVLDNSNRLEYESERNWLNRNSKLLYRAKGKGGTYTWTEFYQWLG